ncbi:HpcH/HpaI aldolase family protein [Endozoicomonas sp. ALD040]|uniref:HpcH/HpaI aldolase family protein n=1 Tax=unclassified Endozoicomonas TaxID=2644528 RepID=UPI003BAF92E6
MRKNLTLLSLRQGKFAIGTWLQMNSFHAARLLAGQGFFHWLLLDLEHTPYDYPTAAIIMSTISDISDGRITPLVRVPVGSIEHIKSALDCGAQGIIVPMINTADDVKRAVAYARFPPDGKRGGGGLAPHLGFGVNRPQYLSAANQEILVGIQIETKESIDNLDEILDVPGVDLFFIGPNDLHMSLGLPARFWSDEPTFVSATEKVIKGCKKRNIPVGTLCREASQVKERMQDGLTFLGMGSDAHFMLTFAGQQYGQLNNLEEPAETWCNSVNL